MIATTTIKRTKVPLKRILMLLLILFFIITSIILIETNNSAYPLIFLSFFPYYVLFSIIGDYKENPVNLFDKRLVLSSDELIIDNSIYQLAQLEKLVICISEFDGKEIYSPYYTGMSFFSLIYRKKKILNGTRNKFSFIYNGIYFEYLFYISSEDQKNQFKTLFESWYTQKINFKEINCSGKRTYLLEELSYKEIQSFKEKYQVG